MTGKHRRPRHSSGRNLAATAAVITAGALPLAVAGNAFAATAPAASSPLSALPLGSVEGGLDQMAQPLQGALPLAGAVAQDVSTSVGSGDLPVGGLLGTSTPQTQARDAAVDQQTALDSADLAAKTTALTGKVSSVLPVSGLIEQVAPAMAGQPMQVAPTLLQDGAVGTLTDGFGARTMDLTNGLVGQMNPVVQQLHTAGVPTVGDVTSALSTTKMPVFGTVGGLTSAVPVSEMLGGGSPIVGTVGAASGL
jgi:hypothetical protein